VKLWYGGSEVSSHRKLLIESHIETVSLSYVGLCRRIKFARPWTLDDHYPEWQKIFLDSGAFTLNKPGSEVTAEEAEELATKYMAFVLENIGRVEMVSEFDATILGRDNLLAMRDDFYSALPQDKFLPIWHGADGIDELESLASRYRRVGVAQGDLDEDLTTRLNRLVTRHGVKLHGVAMTAMQPMQDVQWDSVGSGSWYSPSQYGDTFVWSGSKLIRYPKAQKEKARRRHAVLFEREGFDADKILADDTTEVLKLSLWSWQQFMQSIERRRIFNPFGESVTDAHALVNDDDAEPSTDAVDEGSLSLGTGRSIVLPRATVMLPLMQTVLAGDKEHPEDHIVEVRSGSLRMCDNCFLSTRGCPGFKPGSNCAFDIPIVIKTSTQLKAVRDALIAMQTQRVLMLQMKEQLDGMDADPNLSLEMDRLTKMITARFTAEREGVTFTQTLTAGGGQGFLSKHFTPEIAETVTALPAPYDADQFMQEQGVVDGEIVT
jgi:hypothetical protein